MPQEASPNFLTPAAARLAQSPDFKLIGRQADLDALHDTLMRKDEGLGDNVRNNAIVFGQNGVGLSSLVLSLQAAKSDLEDLTTPLEIVNKNYFFLDVNTLFSQSGKDAVTKGFQEALKTLRATPDSVLIIEDGNSFVKGIANNQATNLISELMESTGPKNEFQTIFMGSHEDVGLLNSCHTDIVKNFALQRVQEPSKDELRAILEHKAKKIGEKYGLEIKDDAIKVLMQLIEKYPGITSVVKFAQPRCAIELLEGAAVSYARTARTRPHGMDELEAKLADIAAAQEGKATGTAVDDLSADELAKLLEKTQGDIAAKTDAWKAGQKKLRELRKTLDAYPAKLQLIQSSIDKQVEVEEAKRKAYADLAAAGDDEALKAQIKKDFHDIHGIDLADKPAAPAPEEEKSARGSFNVAQNMAAKMAKANLGASNARIDKEKELLLAGRKEYDAKRAEFEALAKAENSLVMTDTQVLAEFSRVSTIEVSKLQQDQSMKLLKLEEVLGARIFGQPDPLKGLAKAVRTAKAGMKNKTAAIGNFLFLGPTGTGKTETALALAEALFGDDAALRKYNMEDYGEENAVTQLVGAPQGYMGHEEGGQLVNNMIERPECVNLFDEIEKAHAKVLNPFLAITDTKNAYLLDRRTGDKIRFSNAVNIFTSNVGQKYFLDQSLSRDQARELALEELRHFENGKFKPEFLGRLNIFCYDRLTPEAVESIAKKSLREVNDLAVEQGITLNLPVDENIKQMCGDVYDPLTGGRGIVKYVDSAISSQISEIILQNPDTPGTVAVTYIPGKVTDEEIAQIRETVEEEGNDGFIAEYAEDFKKKLTKEFKNEKADTPEQEAALVEKKKARLNELVEEKAKELTEAKIAARVKALKKERGVIDTNFVPANAAEPAPASKAPANQNVAAGKTKPAVG